jgi:HEPN domain-containing protein
MAKAPSPKLSPLLRSAFEVLNHGLWHFFRSTTTTDMKFALLHVDQAVELLLKERIRAGGKSIYKNPKETITIWGAYDLLKELHVDIPERPDLELLHEERNSIQHKYLNPSAEDAAFHIGKAMEFVRRFVRDELKLDIKEHISSEYLEQV